MPANEIRPNDNLRSPQSAQRSWDEWRDLFLEQFHALKAANAEWYVANIRGQLP